MLPHEHYNQAIDEAIDELEWPQSVDCGCIIDKVKDYHFTLTPCSDHIEEFSEKYDEMSYSIEARTDDDED